MENKQQDKSLNFEIKQENLSEDGTFTAYGAVFGNEDDYSDIIEKGAFNKTLTGKLPKLLYQHSWDYPIGSITKAYEDNTGLYVEGKINLNVEKGKEAYELLMAKNIDGLSIGYQTVKFRYDTEKEIRYLEEVKLREVSIVTFPANERATLISIKQEGKMSKDINKLIEEAKSLKDFENIFKELGLTKSQKTAIVSKIKNIANEEYLEKQSSVILEEKQRYIFNLATKVLETYNS